MIWWLPGTQLGFVVKYRSEDEAQIAGRAHLLSPSGPQDALTLWQAQSARIEDNQQAKQSLQMSLAILIDLMSLATVRAEKQAIAEEQEAAKKEAVANERKAAAARQVFRIQEHRERLVISMAVLCKCCL